MYPYLPSVDRFKTVVTKNWLSIHPETSIQLEPFNCYHNPQPPKNMDAFVIDNILMEYYLRKGFIEPLNKSSIVGIDDFFKFAINSEIMESSENYHCIPIFGCSFMLFYRSDDTEMPYVETIFELLSVIGDNSHFTTPQKGKGLLFTMTSKNDMLGTYMMLEEYINNTYSKNPSYPTFPHKPAFSFLQLLVRMTGVEIAKSKSLNLVKEFENGNGRAFVGFSESLAEFDPEYLSSNGVEIKIIPLHPSRSDSFNLMFVDSLCLNSNIEESKKQLVLELMNLVVSKNTMIEILSSGGIENSPQFVIPSRISTIEKLSANNRNYRKIWNIISNAQGKLPFFIGPDIFEWLGSKESDDFMTEIFKL